MNAARLHRFMEPTLWMITVAAIATAVVGWRRATQSGSVIAAAHLTPPPASRTWRADSLTHAAAATVASDPFRLDRRPADVPYHAASNGAPPPPRPQAPPKPVLSLAGIVGGPPWTALLDGAPGRKESVVVHAGEVVDDLTVRAIGKDTVVVRGMDTTWTLTLKHPWR